MRNQPMEIDSKGVIRFKANPIVVKLLDVATSHGYSLNQIYPEFEDTEYYVQLMQLIGYSLSGYSELSCVSDKEYKRAEESASRLLGGKDENRNRNKKGNN